MSIAFQDAKQFLIRVIHALTVWELRLLVQNRKSIFLALAQQAILHWHVTFRESSFMGIHIQSKPWLILRRRLQWQLCLRATTTYCLLIALLLKIWIVILFLLFIGLILVLTGVWLFIFTLKVDSVILGWWLLLLLQTCLQCNLTGFAWRWLGLLLELLELRQTVLIGLDSLHLLANTGGALRTIRVLLEGRIGGYFQIRVDWFGVDRFVVCFVAWLAFHSLILWV